MGKKILVWSLLVWYPSSPCHILGKNFSTTIWPRSLDPSYVASYRMGQDYLHYNTQQWKNNEKIMELNYNQVYWGLTEAFKKKFPFHDNWWSFSPRIYLLGVQFQKLENNEFAYITQRNAFLYLYLKQYLCCVLFFSACSFQINIAKFSESLLKISTLVCTGIGKNIAFSSLLILNLNL